LSDHGTTVGLPHDRIVSTENYQGSKDKLKYISVFKLGITNLQDIDLKKEYTINTSYGQGSDILSLKQNQILLAFHGFGKSTSSNINTRVSLLDITPTVLDFLHQKNLSHVDGTSLMPLINHSNIIIARPLFLETGYSLAAIETNDI